LGVVAALSSACGANSSAPGREGDLGNGVFAYNCQDPSDSACPSGLSAISQDCQQASVASSGTNCFPSSIAVGGKFRIQYHVNPSQVSNAGNPTLRAVSSDYLVTAGDGIFMAKKSGYVGVVATSTVNSNVLDYTLLRMAPVAALKLQDNDSGKPALPTTDVIVGQSRTYHVIAQGKLTEQLAGAIDVNWTSSDPTIVQLKSGNPNATMEIQVLKAGQATITAKTEDGIAASVVIDGGP
jgi:uncharacterized protein YjdB